MKLYEAVNIYEITKNIIEDKNSDITPLSKFKLLGIIRGFAGVYTDYEQTRQDLIKTYGDKVIDEEGNETGNIEIKKDADNWDKFVSEINTIRNQDVDVEFTPISVDELFNMGLSAEICSVFVPIVKQV